MRHPGLKLRMAVVGTVLFAFYSAVALFAWMATGSLLLVAVATVGFVIFQYKFGKWMALKSVGAEDLPEGHDVRRMVESLAEDMDVEMPRVMGAQMGTPNAFAVGRKGAGVVVVSEELLSILDRDELEGVLAHELAHIRNRDVVTMVLGQSIASLIGIAAQFAVLFAGDNDFGDLIMAMVVGNLVQMVAMVFVFAISRYREYVADSDAADTIGGGDPLARALEKIHRAAEQGQAQAAGRGRGRGRGQRGGGQVDDKVSALCIFGGERGLLASVFATHPPVEKRIEKLRS
jgi:heat shock protein HtpX